MTHCALLGIYREIMKSQVIYSFESAQLANRFLNTLKHWHVADVDARFYAGNKMIRITYEIEAGAFDRTLSELDDLASQHQGTEVSAP